MKFLVNCLLKEFSLRKRKGKYIYIYIYVCKKITRFHKTNINKFFTFGIKRLCNLQCLVTCYLISKQDLLKLLDSRRDCHHYIIYYFKLPTDARFNWLFNLIMYVIFSYTKSKQDSINIIIYYLRKNFIQPLADVLDN